MNVNKGTKELNTVQDGNKFPLVVRIHYKNHTCCRLETEVVLLGGDCGSISGECRA